MPSVIVIGFVKLDPLFGDDFVPEGSTACLVYDDSSGNKNLFTGSDACYSISAGGYYRLNAEVENNQYYDIYVRLNFKNDIVSIQKNSTSSFLYTLSKTWCPYSCPMTNFSSSLSKYDESMIIVSNRYAADLPDGESIIFTLT